MNEAKFKKDNKNIIDIFNDYVNLFKFRKLNEIKNFDYNKLKDNNNKLFFDIRVILTMFDNFESNFKFEKDFLYYEYLCDLYKKYNLDKFDLFLIRLTKAKRGNYLLYKLYKDKKFTDFFGADSISYNIDIASKCGTLPNFIFWEKLLKKKNLDKNCKISTELLISGLSNSDDRIFKYILKNNNYYKIDTKIKNFYNDVSMSLFCNSIPNKYILRRFKFLSNYLEISKNFNDIIFYISDIHIFFKLSKYYYNDEITLTKFSNLIDESLFSGYFTDINKIYKMLKKNKEKDHFTLNLISSFCKYKSNDIDSIDFIDPFNIFNLLTNDADIFNLYYLDILKYLESNINFLNIKLIKNILNKFKQFDLVNRYLILNYSRYKKCNVMKKCSCCCNFHHIMNFIPYCNYIKELKEENYLLIQVNKIMLNLKIYIRKIKNIKILTRKTYYYNLLKEVKTFKPNPNKKVLKNGSINFILSKQAFNYKPPYHLHFGEINKLNNILIREKADGVLVKRLPISTTPSNISIKNHRIKAEFIEDLDLYLIFDIEIPNISIKDRYNFIREAHPFTKSKKLNMINDYQDLKQNIIEERELFNTFLNQDYDCYRWYPKASWEVYNLSHEFRNNLIKNVILEEDKEFICNDKNYKNDGLILVPLNGLNEIKMKPKSLMTIDLLCKDNKWFDSDKNDWSSIIKSNNESFDGFIMRCYPLENGYYEPRDIRFDKKFPNNYKIIIGNIKFYKNSWINHSNKIVYYDKNINRFNKHWLKIIKKNEINFKKMIYNMLPLENSNWLDLGCGKGKLFNFIKKLNPKSYLGIDCDLNVILSCIHRFSNDINFKMLFNVNFVNTDLNNDWNEGNNNWYKINYDIKMDYIVSIFSLMYFCTDIFWENINKISRKGTKMLFNLVNEKSEKRIEFNGSYLYRFNDKIKYLFTHIHNKEKEEDYISENKLNRFLNKYEWTIKEKFTPNSYFESYYSWYIIEKN